jgi:hypothetical protein
MKTSVSVRESWNGAAEPDAISWNAISWKLMSSMAQNPCARRIAAIPAGSKRLTERFSLSCTDLVPKNNAAAC